MAAFPAVKFDWRDLAADHESVVERSEMERGLAKQRRVQSDVVVTLQLTIHFDSKAEDAAFVTWFYTDINAGQDFFDFTDPDTGAAVQGRVPGGKLGGKRFKQRTLEAATRTMNVEFVRSAW